MAILPGEGGNLAYAHLVLEMLGYVQSRLMPAGENPRNGLWLASAATAPSGDLPGLREHYDGTGPLLRGEALRLGPEVAVQLAPLIGLYRDLDNYNGMAGVDADFRIPGIGWFPRARELAPANVRGGRDLPARIWRARAVPGDPLVVLDDGTPVVARNGVRIELGLPLFSLLVEHLTVPAFPPDRYRFSDTTHHLLALAGALIGMIAPPGTVRVHNWPNDAPSAVALRHDHDRPFDLKKTVDAENRLGLRPSIHFLDRLPPEQDVVALARAGALEAGLHTNTLAAQGADIAALAGRSGLAVHGGSAHGGAGSDGWQGAANVIAAHASGVDYGELLSEMHLLPHRYPDPSRPGEALHPIAMPHHLSYDVSRTAHDEARLRATLPGVAAAGGLAVLMNHPDLHHDAFMAFLADAVPKTAWHGTLAEVAAWWRATHVTGCLDIGCTLAADGLFLVSGKAAEAQAGLRVSVRSPVAGSAKGTGVTDIMQSGGWLTFTLVGAGDFGVGITGRPAGIVA
jgi:hypothetical protein